jgi:hypothetical protein
MTWQLLDHQSHNPLEKITWWLLDHHLKTIAKKQFGNYQIVFLLPS